MHEELPLFIHWVEFLDWLLSTTEKFPKKVRFTFSTRMDNLALDILEEITEACYKASKKEILGKINLDLTKLRVMLRLCYKRKFISIKQLEHAAKKIDETGKMTGGWLNQQKEQK